MLKIIREFCSLVRPHIEGNRYYFRIDNVIDVCAAYADESIYGGYRGIRQYIDSPRQAFDELGSETLPTGRYGNFENVMQYIFQSRYDNRYTSSPMPPPTSQSTRYRRPMARGYMTASRRCSISSPCEERHSG